MNATPDGTTPRSPRDPVAPVRTCVGCRSPRPQEDLVRLAVVPDAPYVVPDAKGALGGRGVWVMPNPTCLERAAKKGGFSRSLKRQVSIDPELLRTQIQAQLERRLEGLANGARRARHAQLGAEAVQESIDRGRATALWVAEDAARRDALEAMAERLGCRLIVLGSRGWLGELFGRDLLAVVALEHEGLATAIGQVTKQLIGLRRDSDVRTGGAAAPELGSARSPKRGAIEEPEGRNEDE